VEPVAAAVARRMDPLGRRPHPVSYPSSGRRVRPRRTRDHSVDRTPARRRGRQALLQPLRRQLEQRITAPSGQLDR
jgi:hypothetical protein